MPSHTWVMLIKSKYNKHNDKDGFYIYKAKGKFISENLLNTSEYALRVIRNHTCLSFLPNRTQTSKQMYSVLAIWARDMAPIGSPLAQEPELEDLGVVLLEEPSVELSLVFPHMH